MGSKWNGFLPQNDVIKIHWAVMEACQSEDTAKALSSLLANIQRFNRGSPEEEPEEGSWQSADSSSGDQKA